MAFEEGFQDWDHFLFLDLFVIDLGLSLVFDVNYVPVVTHALSVLSLSTLNSLLLFNHLL